MNFFNEDNFLVKALNTIGDVIIANILFVVCSIPIITIGPSFTALYHCMLRSVKGNNNGTIKTFFRAFKENFKQSLAIWLMFLAAFLILFCNISFLQQNTSGIANVFLIGTYSILVLAVIVFLYVFPVIAAFHGTIKSHLKNAVSFASMQLPSTIAIAVISVFPVAVTFSDYELFLVYLTCWIFFAFGTIAYINSKIFYRMFKPYLGEEDEEDDHTFFINADEIKELGHLNEDEKKGL